MSLVQFLRILMARRAIILGVMAACFIGALVVAKLLPPQYPAKARVIFDVIKPDPVTGQVIASQFERSYTLTQIELITDYRVAGDVVDRLKLTENPEMIRKFERSSDGEQDLRRWVVKYVIDHTDAGLLEGSNILEITYKAEDPAMAKRVVTSLRDAYIDASLRFRTDAAGRTADWYLDQAAKAQRALATAEASKSAFERENNIVMVPGGGDAESAKLDGLQNALMMARGSSGSIDANVAISAASSPAVEQLKSQLNAMDDAIAQAQEKLGPSNPTYIGLVQRRALLARQLSRETSVARSVGSISSASSRASVGQLQSEYAAQRVKVLAMKPQLDRLAQLQRETDLRREQYEKAAARAGDLRLQASVSETGLVVLGDAISSPKPSFPNMPLIAAAALAGGLALGLLVGVIAELISRRVRSSEDLAHASRVPVLAVIGSPRGSQSGGWLRRLSGRRSSPNPEWQVVQ